MASIHWKSLSQLEEGREYLIVATTGLEIPWFQPVRMLRFAVSTLGILRQLGRTRGCLAYSLRAGFHKGSTISVWEDVASLRHFQHQNPHASAMKAFRSGTARPFRYAQWNGSVHTIPSGWEEITDHFATATPSV